MKMAVAPASSTAYRELEPEKKTSTSFAALVLLAASVTVLLWHGTFQWYSAEEIELKGDTLGDIFPANVIIVTKGTVGRVQAALDEIEATNGGRNCHGQFSQERFAMFFMPGEYDLDVRVPFYMQVAGLGRRPDDVSFTGPYGVHARNCGPEPPSPHVGKDYADVGALDNFWRSAENLRVAGRMIWATSQAAPLRSVHTDALTFSDGRGWSSGGYAANLRVAGAIDYGTQQQAIIRNSKWATVLGLPSFNTVAVGTLPTLPSRCDSVTAVAGVPETPLIAEKPYLTIAKDGSGELMLAIPSLERRVRGPRPPSEDQREERVRDAHQVFVATAADSAAVINRHLAMGRHVILSPGIYDVEEPLVVGGAPGQVLLGLGFATLTPTHGNAAVIVVSAGARFSGVLIQAGTQ